MGISPIQLLIVLVIVVLIFGGKRLRTLGSDLGSAIKGFKNEMKSEEETSQPQRRETSHVRYWLLGVGCDCRYRYRRGRSGQIA